MRYSSEDAEAVERNSYLVQEEVGDTLDSLLSKVAPFLKKERAREFLRHGVCRRLQIIRRCISNIFSIFPVQRTELLDLDELGDVGINLHAFLINTHGIPDNLAWTYLLERETQIKPWEIGLFNPKTEFYLPPEVVSYVKSEKIAKWHAEYAKNYRDALAHRIPPYVAPSVLTPDHHARYQRLEEQITLASKAGDVERALALSEEQDTCGEVCFAFSQSFLDEKACPPIMLHAQLLQDARTVLQLIAVIRPHLCKPV
jgi:hypothetical protein